MATDQTQDLPAAVVATGLLLLLVLFGCAETVHVQVTPENTTVTVPPEIAKLHENSPLPENEWAAALTNQSIPVFPTGTSEDEVRAVLADRNLQIVADWPGYLIVREGIPLLALASGVRLNYLYGFTEHRLTLGPQDFDKMTANFLKSGLTAEKLQILHLFASRVPNDPTIYNNYAWLLATYPDAQFRNGPLAVEFAQRAIDLAQPIPWNYVDTLAAAYAAAGDFENAVIQQERAIELSNTIDEAATRQLQLFRNGQIHVSSIEELLYDDEAPPEYVASADPATLLHLAAAGSADAQWSLAVFYLENEKTEDRGIAAPAVFWLKAAAANEHPYAANELGNCFRVAGCGVTQDFDEAVRWYQLAIERGDSMAGWNLGLMYAYGHGAPHDDIEATRLLAMAADGGMNGAAFNVALRYKEGLGAPPDFAAYQKFQQQIESAGYGIADYLIDESHYYKFPGVETVAASLGRSAVPPDRAAEALLAIADQFEEAYEASDDTFVVNLSQGMRFEYESSYGPFIVLNLVRISAVLGSSQAQRRLAEHFEVGDTVPNSQSEASYWRQRANQ